MSIQTINPANGSIINKYDLTADAQLETILTQAQNAQQKWANNSFKTRANYFIKLAAILRSKAENLANLITTEMGKPITQARGEIEKCAWLCEHYADHAEEYLKPQHIKTDHKKSYYEFKPLGTILGIMPWNFPLWQVLRFSVPTLMAGNAVVIKLAENCTGCGIKLAEIFKEAEFPPGVFNNVLINHDKIGDVIKDNRIHGLSLTGSEQAGSIVAAQAGKYLKKVVLELGGNDPYVVLADADLKLAVKYSLESRLNNTGQVCIAAKRFIVVKEVKDEFTKLIMDSLEDFPMGDPTKETVKLGPLARSDLRETLHKQVTLSIANGADCLTGGFVFEEGLGNYYPLTVLDNVTKDMPAYDEELFGPVVSLITANDELEAIKIANDSKYGLAAAVFSKNLSKAEEIALHRINAGTVAVNNLVASDPRLPFGGIKSSGFGRELGNVGIQEFINIKTLVVE